jgi:glycosyltransferase involved in cell wall biosynthesis
MTKIVLVTYELNHGGTNRVSCQLANGFAEAGNEVRLVACTSAGVLDMHYRSNLKPEVASFAFSKAPWKSRTLGQIATFFAYRKWLKRERPDILLATGNNISWFTGLGLFSLRRHGARFFIKTTNPIIRERDSRFITFVRRQVYGFMFRLADGILTLSDCETRMLQSQFPDARDKFQTVFNAYLTGAFEGAENRQKKRAPENPLVILGVGRLVDQKNFSRLLRAFAACGADNAVLKIAGEGEQREMLQQLARELGIEDKVEFLGFVSDVPAAMSSADLFVLSSDYEGLPAVVVEALACNCPVISTDCFANVRTLLKDLPGCAVTEKSAEALAAAMRAWLDHPVLKPDLRPHAMKYSTASSVDSHLKAMMAA